MFRICAAIIAVLTVAACAPMEQPGTVSKEAFRAEGKRWPLTIEKGVVGCTGLAYWFEADGVRYGLNGFAKSGDYADLKPIWLEDHSFAKLQEKHLLPHERRETPVVRVSIGDLIDAADEACPDD